MKTNCDFFTFLPETKPKTFSFKMFRKTSTENPTSGILGMHKSKYDNTDLMTSTNRNITVLQKLSTWLISSGVSKLLTPLLQDEHLIN